MTRNSSFYMLIIVFFGLAKPLQAQLLDRYLPALVLGPNELGSNTVLSRPRPNYESGGQRLGDVIIMPSLQQSVGYDSNVFGQAHGPGSTRFESAATVQANTDWERDSLGSYVNVDNVEMPQASQLSHTDVTASIAGTLDVGRGQLQGSYAFLNLTLLPTDIEGSGLREAVPFQINDIRASYTAPLSRFSLVPDIQMQTYRFSKTGTAGSPTGLSYLDRDVVTPGLTTRFELAPQRDLLLVTRETTAHYMSAQLGMPQRNYMDTQILAGLDYTASAVFRYRVLAGYEFRNYNSRQINGMSAPIVEASVIWTPSLLNTITGTVTRRIEDAIEDNVADYIYTEARLQIDSEIRRDVLVQTYADAQRVAYQRASDMQTVLGAGVSATWLMNHHLQSQINFGYANSTGMPLTTYTREVVLLHMTVKF